MFPAINHQKPGMKSKKKNKQENRQKRVIALIWPGNREYFVCKQTKERQAEWLAARLADNGIKPALN